MPEGVRPRDDPLSRANAVFQKGLSACPRPWAPWRANAEGEDWSGESTAATPFTIGLQLTRTNVSLPARWLSIAIRLLS
jgi:hypothetical protein